MKGVTSTCGNRPGRSSSALEVGRWPPRPKRACAGFLAAFVTGALILVGPVWAELRPLSPIRP